MNRRVFISYRRLDKDSAVVDELTAKLSEFNPWRDTADIVGRQVWRETIASAIDASFAMILVVSADTEQSKEVYAEYFHALARKVQVIPLLIADCKLPFDLGNTNARLWFKDCDRALQELRDDLKRYRDEASPLEPASDMRTYLGAMQLGCLMAVGNYTPMTGEGRFRPELASRGLRPVAPMKSEFTWRRSATSFGDRPAGEQRRTYDDLLPALHQAERVMVLGEPGIGKTATLHKFADELARRALERDGAPIPVIVPLREWRDDVTLGRADCRRLGVLAPQYRQLLASGRIYFLLDGLNELPRDDRREAKPDALQRLLVAETRAVVTCREIDYRDEALRLDLDTITIHPLDPERVWDFLRRYLIDLRGENDGSALADELFWQIAGGPSVKAVWEEWRGTGADINLFFATTEIPKAVYAVISGADDAVWRNVVKTLSNLIHLAANPFLLSMMLRIYLDKGAIPPNRGALFDEFVFQLLKREELADDDKLNGEGPGLPDANLEELGLGHAAPRGRAGETRGGSIDHSPCRRRYRGSAATMVRLSPPAPIS